MADTRRQSTTAAESADGMWQQDDQRMSGFKVIAAIQGQDDRQDHGAGEVKEGNRAEQNQDDLHRRCFGR